MWCLNKTDTRRDREQSFVLQMARGLRADIHLRQGLGFLESTERIGFDTLKSRSRWLCESHGRHLSSDAQRPRESYPPHLQAGLMPFTLTRSQQSSNMLEMSSFFLRVGSKHMIGFGRDCGLREAAKLFNMTGYCRYIAQPPRSTRAKHNIHPNGTDGR
jgi:hypothetical protein